MQYFPVYIKLSDKACLIVGGGGVATRKARLLAKAAGKVIVVAPELDPALVALASELTNISLLKTVYEPNCLEGITLVIAATNQVRVNQQVSEDAEARNILVNVVDRPTLCRFIMPSIIDRSPLVVALASNGKTPVLLRLLRTRLEALLPASFGKLADLVGRYRAKVKAVFKDSGQRRDFWEDVLEGDIAELVHKGSGAEAEQRLIQRLQYPHNSVRVGEVYLVGAGPGDPDLLTFHALRLMQKADVVVYDRLVAKPILELVRRDADRIYVGKQQSQHTLPQEDINQLLVRLAKEGRRVLRLKGGDPFIFGRGGEEIETLMQEGVLFRVVPGITSASGAACYSGIPLTHRDYAQSVVFATGHLKDDTVDLNWEALVQKNQTVVIYMGLTGLKIISEKLIQYGMPPEMPTAVVRSATTAQQEVVIACLQDIDQRVRQANLRPPALIIVGDVVRLHEKLQWFAAVQQKTFVSDLAG